jgi:ComF family protein
MRVQAITLLARWSEPALDWLSPRSCVLCNASGAMLCTACRADATVGSSACCPRCAIPLHADVAERLCGRCLKRPPAYDRTIAATRYDAPFDQLVRGLKYGATLAYAPLLAELLHTRAVAMLGHDLGEIDVIVPVPLSRARMAARGFNQSIEVARTFSRRSSKPLDNASVLRIHDTLPQASLRFDARRSNVRGAFAVIDRRRDALAGRRIGVIDDVMTTGATLDELAKILKRAGAATVVNLVVARTP